MDRYCIIVEYQNDILSALKSISFCNNPTADRQQWKTDASRGMRLKKPQVKSIDKWINEVANSVLDIIDLSLLRPYDKSVLYNN